MSYLQQNELISVGVGIIAFSSPSAKQCHHLQLSYSSLYIKHLNKLYFHLPSRIILKPLIESLSGTNFPAEPVKTSATCESQHTKFVIVSKSFLMF